jgi:hypothetical protein
MKLKKSATKTFSLLHEANVEDPYQYFVCFEWHKRFSEGRKHAEDTSYVYTKNGPTGPGLRS